METYGAALERIWKETECAGDPTAVECMNTCAHRRACLRMVERARLAVWLTADASPAQARAEAMGCDECETWEWR